MKRFQNYFRWPDIVLLVALIGALVGRFYCVHPEEKYESIVAQELPATVTIKVYENETHKHYFLGSGVIVSPRGHILTAAHLFTENRYGGFVSVYTKQDKEYPIIVMRLDKDRDLALVKFDPNALFPNSSGVLYAYLAPSDNVVVGEEVIAIGSPRGFNWSVSNGIVSAVHRDEFFTDSIQTNVALNPGNSGGPLFDLKGEVVGINNLIVSPIPAYTGLSFSISTKKIREFLEEYKGLDKTLN